MDFYEIYATIYLKSKKTDHMTVDIWEEDEEKAIAKAKNMILDILGNNDEIKDIICQISKIFPRTLKEFVYEELKKSHLGRKKKQGIIQLKDMTAYLRDNYGIKNISSKEAAADIIMDKNADKAVEYFKEYLFISEDMFMKKFGWVQQDLLLFEKQGKLKIAYMESYGDKNIKYYKAEAFFQNIN